MIRTACRSFFHLLLVGAPLLGLSLGGRNLQAQALATATGKGGYVSLGAGGSDFPSDYDGRKIGGGMAFMDIQPTWRFGLEGEARFLRYNTDEGVDQSNYLIGLRVGMSPRRLRPYAKFLVGATKIDAPFGYGRGTFFTYAPGAGVDYLLTDRVTLRIPDLEYQVVPQFIGSNIRNFGLSMGLSFGLTELCRFPNGRKLCR